MSVYLKLAKVRNLLAQAELKKSGKNTHSGFQYLELTDFIPATMAYMDLHHLCGVFTFDAAHATLTIVDADDPAGKIEFRCPLVSATLPKAQEIQNLGGSITYLRRYLWIMALELAVPDFVDSQPQLAAKSHPAFTKKIEEIADDMPDITLEQRKEQIVKINFTSGLDMYYRGLPKELQQDEDILKALSDRKYELSPVGKI